MHTSIVWLALTGLAAPAEGASLKWMSDYSQARRVGAAQNKPLAVFLSPGKEGWGILQAEDGFGGKVGRFLAKHYVCVRVDTTTAAGQQLATAFEMPNGLGLVLSDRTGKLQAFRHAGELGGDDLSRYLARYATPDRPVQSTATHTTGRTSFSHAPTTITPTYPPAFQGWTQPNYGYSPGFSGGGACRT